MELCEEGKRKKLKILCLVLLDSKCIQSKKSARQPKHQVDTHVQLHKKKTVISLKFKTVFAPEIQLYLHRNDNS